MTTFVTGATGDLGRVLVRELVQQGHAVRLLVQPDSNRAGLELPGVEFVRGSIHDAVVVRKGITGCDRVCHLAAEGSDAGESALWRGNRDGTAVVLQAAYDMRVASFVVVSDLALLGPTEPDAAADESRALNLPTQHPSSAYLQSRHAADTLAHDFAAKGLPVKIVYPGAGYGCVRPPGQGGLAESMLLRLATNKPVAVPGDGQHQVGMSYFKDTARGIILAHEWGRAGQSYILAGDTVTWLQAWEAVAEVLGKATPQRHTPLWLARMTGALPAEILTWAGQNWSYSNEKARRDLGWRPFSFRDGMAETWEELQSLEVGARRPEPVRVMRRA